MVAVGERRNSGEQLVHFHQQMPVGFVGNIGCEDKNGARMTS